MEMYPVKKKKVYGTQDLLKELGDCSVLNAVG